MHKKANFNNNGDEKLKLGFCDGRVDGEHNGVGLVAISNIFAMQDIYSFDTDQFDRAYTYCRQLRVQNHL